MGITKNNNKVLAGMLLYCLCLLISCSETKYAYRKKFPVKQQESTFNKETTRFSKSLKSAIGTNDEQKKEIESVHQDEAAIISTPSAIVKSVPAEFIFSNKIQSDSDLVEQDITIKDNPTPAEKKTSSLAALSMLLGAILLSPYVILISDPASIMKYFGLLMIAGGFVLVLGLFGLGQVRSNPEEYQGGFFATIGILIGLLFIVTAIIVVSSHTP